MILDNCVYRHRRLDTNQIFYVGIGNSKRPYIKSNRNKYWKNIVNKYGYSVEILAKNLSKDDACELEILLIKEYGRKNLNTGNLVNITKGGETLKGYKHTIEAKNNMSIAAKNKIVTKETRINMSIAKGIKIINTETNIIYRSITNAANEFNISTSTLARYLKGSCKSKTNYPFRYL